MAPQCDAGAPKLAEPLANPVNYFEMRFLADPSQGYKLWIRLKAEGDNWANDSVFVSSPGAQDGAGNPIYQIGTTSALAVNLEECSNCGVSGWGWEDDGWGAVNKNGTTLRFPQGGPQSSASRRARTASRSIRSCCRRRNIKSRLLETAKNDTTILLHSGPYLGAVVGGAIRGATGAARPRWRARGYGRILHPTLSHVIRRAIGF